MKMFALLVAFLAALSFTNCELVTMVSDALSASKNPDAIPRATVMFSNHTNKTLVCYVNDSFKGDAEAFGQILVRVDAGMISLIATSDTKTWGPVVIHLAKNETYTWNIEPNG
jgi:hypothetical protein